MHFMIRYDIIYIWVYHSFSFFTLKHLSHL
nr:MAG TPA: hypothetical protein [Caudoviricetes sp.]